MRLTLRRSFLFLYIVLFLILTVLNLMAKILPVIDDTEDPNYASATTYLFLNIFKRESTKRLIRPLALFPEDSQETDRILDQLNYIPGQLAPQPVRIYLPQGANGVPLGNKEFEIQNCRVKNCIITTDKTDSAVAEVVYFRNAIPWSLANKRLPGQLWVMQLLESPEYTSSLHNINKKINYTATYRWDSDLVTPYERWTPLADVPLDQRFPANSPKQLPYKGNYAHGKSKLVAWFVSHCHTNNDRFGYATELSKHITIDIYGSCGKNKCDRLNEDCWKQLDQDYKFYLSFENSNCQDYVTEKYFVNGLQHDVIPIVMGASRTFYEKISPPHSFIHVDDFHSPKELAAYLHFLDSNDSAYNKYFAWKGSGQFINTKFWCRLCALVQKPKPRVVDNLYSWWKSTNTCTTAWTKS